MQSQESVIQLASHTSTQSAQSVDEDDVPAINKRQNAEK